MGRDPDAVDPSQFWGDNYFLDRDPSTGKLLRNYFVAEVDKVARYALPFVKNIAFMM